MAADPLAGHFRAEAERDAAFRAVDSKPRGMNGMAVLPGRLVLRAVPGDEFIANFVPPIYAIDPSLVGGQLVALTAPPNAGKTTVAVLLSLMAAGLASVPSLEVTSGRVLYLIGENDANLQIQLLAACEAYGIAPEQLREHLWVVPQRFGLSMMTASITSLAEKIGGLALIVVDTRIAFSEAMEENDNASAAENARVLRELTQIAGKPTVLALCHPPKGAGEDSLYPRGGSAFFGEIDCNLTLWTVDTAATLGANKRRSPPFEPLRFELRQTNLQDRADHKGRPIRSVVAHLIDDATGDALDRQAGEDESRVLYELLHSPDASIADWATNCGWSGPNGPSKSRVHRCLRRLEESGLARKRGRRWTLTDAGKRCAGGVR